MKGNFVKWIGGGLGWACGGPWGGVVGFIAGTVYDSLEIRIFRKSGVKPAMGDFSTSLLVLVAAVMKAERPVVKAELDYVKQFLKKNFGEKGAQEALVLLKEILKQNIPLDSACTQIRNSLDYSSRLQLIHFLYNLANVDGHVTGEEQNMLDLVSRGLKVSVSEKRSVGAMLVQEESIIAAYGILGVSRTASIIDIKKAYRSMAVRYHPDKVAYLGDELRKIANEKFQRLTHAYEIIKKDRNFT